MRWSLKPQQYDFTVSYKPGAQHGNEDALSRRLYGSTAITKSRKLFGSAINLPNKGYDEIRIFQQKEPELPDQIKYLHCGILPADKKNSEKI